VPFTYELSVSGNTGELKDYVTLADPLTPTVTIDFANLGTKWDGVDEEGQPRRPEKVFTIKVTAVNAVGTKINDDDSQQAVMLVALTREACSKAKLGANVEPPARSAYTLEAFELGEDTTKQIFVLPPVYKDTDKEEGNCIPWLAGRVKALPDTASDEQKLLVSAFSVVDATTLSLDVSKADANDMAKLWHKMTGYWSLEIEWLTQGGEYLDTTTTLHLELAHVLCDGTKLTAKIVKLDINGDPTSTELTAEELVG